MNSFALIRPQTLADAAAAATITVAEAMTAPVDLTGHEGVAVVKAGGIDLLDLLKEALLTPAALLSLASVPGLDGIVESDAGDLRIGAMATLARVADHLLVRSRYPALAEALAATASLEIRNVATLGGNLLQRPRCWYFRSSAYHCLRKGGGHCFAIAGENQYHAIFDNRVCAIVHPSTPATVLVALGARVELASCEGTTREVRLEEFFIGTDRDVQRETDLNPHEIMTAVLLAPPAARARMAYVRLGERAAFDWPLADVAVVLDCDDKGICRQAAIILGAAAAVPYRARDGETALVGQRIDETTARRAATLALTGATAFARNSYKLALFDTLIRRAILSAAT
ncbi:FAD binding domain-containing protein [Acidiphilium sp.]|uniref:FAD binding domain-containing protein n=1 Tax=Acidiphilium sp. TaxID=527 RepID=UPI003D065963